MYKDRDNISEFVKNMIWQTITTCHFYLLWKRARLKLLGNYTSNSLKEFIWETFVPFGHKDILTIVIGRLEHPGRVQTVGCSYFETPSRHALASTTISKEQLAEMTQHILGIYGLSQPQTIVQHTGQEPRYPSTKGTCVAPDTSREDTHTYIPYQCELYIDEEDP
ncbi:hypothetical protein CR513_39661, partial [Mucuna pruriens]